METAELYTNKQLRRCLAFLLFALVPYNSFSTGACTEDGTRAVVLDPSIGSQGDSTYDSNQIFNIDNSTWSAPFSYGTINGISACLSSNYGLASYGLYTNNKGKLIDNGNEVIGNEYNGYYCWCKITYPVVSAWMYTGTKPDRTYVDECKNGDINNTWKRGWGSCAQQCVGLLKNRPNMRAALFNSVQN